MKSPLKQPPPSAQRKSHHVPRSARFINTAVAVILLGISAYHYTQPNAAWRSGTTELASALLLLIGAYLVSPLKAISINLLVGVMILGLGIRHIIHGGGWVSGTTELLFAILLASAAVIIFKERNN